MIQKQQHRVMLASILQRGATGVGAQYRKVLVLQEGLQDVYDISGTMGDQNQWKGRRTGLSSRIRHHTCYILPHYLVAPTWGM